MKLHSVFLRDDCVLPNSLNPLRRTFEARWTCVQDIPSPDFDTMIRQAGWHYIWMVGGSSRKGFARSPEKAIGKALIRALRAVSRQANAAEFDSVLVSRCPGFHIATVTVQHLRIQEHAVLRAD